MSTVNADDLRDSCSVLETLQNATSCPCDFAVLHNLTLVVASLAEYYCYYPSTPSHLVPLPAALNWAYTNGTATRPPWCEGPSPWYSTVKFIVPLSLVGALVVLLLVAVVLLYRWRKSEKVQWYIAFALGILKRRPSYQDAESDVTPPSEYQEEQSVTSDHPLTVDRDVFVDCHDDDYTWTQAVVLEALASHRPPLEVITQLDFPLGSVIVEEVLRSVQRSRAVVCVLTENAVRDGWCRDVLIRAYTSQPQSIVPVVRGSSLNVLPEDVLMRNVMRTNSPMYVDETNLKQFSAELRQRVGFILASHAPKNTYRRAF